MLAFLAKYSNGYVISINIAARYNAWLPAYFSTHVAALLASAMAIFTYIKVECIYESLVAIVSTHSHNIRIKT